MGVWLGSPARQEAVRFNSGNAPTSKSIMAIKIKKNHEGLLHEDLGVKPGEPIPLSKIAGAMKNAGPKLKKRLVFAENARKWNHKK
jgi:hypothetical protein